MFSYYGSKSKLVDYYPPPKFDKIIEPFAGSARYALKYWNKQVLLVDKYELIINIWKWLQQCSKQDILTLPRLQYGDEIPNTLSEIEKSFVLYNLHRGRAVPSNKIGKFSDCWEYTIKTTAANIEKIRHWEIKLGSFDEIENTEATWFIDPPYQFGGEHYKHGTRDLDFNKLAEWCKSRNGQVIVCENTKATWLPFKPMIQIQGACQTFTTEAIWSNHKTNYDAVQQSLQF